MGTVKISDRSTRSPKFDTSSLRQALRCARRKAAYRRSAPAIPVPVPCCRSRPVLGYERPADGVLVGAEPDRLRPRVEDHVANRAAAARDLGRREEAPAAGIEADEAVRLRSGLDEPDAAAVIDRHRV